MTKRPNVAVVEDGTGGRVMLSTGDDTDLVITDDPTEMRRVVESALAEGVDKITVFNPSTRPVSVSLDLSVSASAEDEARANHAANEARASLVAELVAAALSGALDRLELSAKRLREHVANTTEAA